MKISFFSFLRILLFIVISSRKQQEIDEDINLKEKLKTSKKEELEMIIKEVNNEQFTMRINNILEVRRSINIDNEFALRKNSFAQVTDTIASITVKYKLLVFFLTSNKLFNATSRQILAIHSFATNENTRKILSQLSPLTDIIKELAQIELSIPIIEQQKRKILPFYDEIEPSMVKNENLYMDSTEKHAAWQKKLKTLEEVTYNKQPNDVEILSSQKKEDEAKCKFLLTRFLYFSKRNVIYSKN